MSKEEETVANGHAVALQPIVKQFVVERDAPKRISHLNFGLFSNQDMMRLSELEIVNKDLYDLNKRSPVAYGCLDPRLGTSDKNGTCGTCQKKLSDCVGHFGYVKLTLPVFHVGYFRHTIAILQSICKTCARVMLPTEERKTYLKRFRNPKTETLARKTLLKRVVERCKKFSRCPFCQDVNGLVKKVPGSPLKIVHERYGKKSGAELIEDFHEEFTEAVKFNKEISQHLNRTSDDLHPLRVMSLFERIPSEDVELLDMNPLHGRPERLILSHMLVPPVSIRPSVSVGSAGSNEDDLTMKMRDIIQVNNVLKVAMEKGATANMLMEDWDFLQLQCAQYINSEMPGLPPTMIAAKPIRGLSQRLKGKTGRFRGNLSGKRVDFSGRTVISPDPNLRIDEVAVPVLIAKVLTYPERVNEANIEALKKLVVNGPDQHPGANFIELSDGGKKFLKYGNRRKIADELRIGDVVERHLQDGDLVLFNRQPSLHRLSIMCHRARVMPWRTLRFNECVCTPYNADFDGDEMNIHVPQTEEARAEALTLMSVHQNLITPRNGEPLVAATQDFLTAAFLLTRRDTFLDRGQISLLCSYLGDGAEMIELPPPVIIKPIELWTGKQVFNVLLRPNRKSKVIVNLELQDRNYSGKGGMFDVQDGYVVFHNSELLSGTLCKTTLGSGTKSGLFFTLIRDNSPRIAAQCMSRLAKLSARWLMNHGMTIGIDDVTPFEKLKRAKDELIQKGYQNCQRYIQQFQKGELALKPGCNAEQTLESDINGELSQIRDRAGNILSQELPPSNKPLIMAICGSKGSNINLCQMIACVGQQTLNGSRIPNGFVNRTLPHFEKNAKHPAAKGFVSNSFYTGLDATEFFFHTMGGREGLVDTAVKTAETGYMQRRLMKALEDLSTKYDRTVRNASGGIVQFVYGDDGLDPSLMEGKDKVLDFGKVLSHVRATHRDRLSHGLKPFQFMEIFNDEWEKTSETRLMTDLFKNDLKDFLMKQAAALAEQRVRVGLPRADLKVDSIKEEEQDEEGWLKQKLIDNLFRVSETQLRAFMHRCFRKYLRAMTEAGEAVGAVGAQSIGEPGTQMTLKTFHFAGVASMNVTLGVPRIKEIINASKKISTPIISAKLVNDRDVKSARIVKGRIEKTLLKDITSYIKEVYAANGCYLSIKLDLEAVEALQLEIDAPSVRRALLAHPKLKMKEKQVTVVGPSKLHVGPGDTNREQMFYSLQNLKNTLPSVMVKGFTTIERAVISKDEKDENILKLLVEGTGLQYVMATPGVDGRHTTSNHVMEVEKVLGIEASRRTIMNEINYTMKSHGMSIDARHITLLADVMTYKGEILGITRFGVAKMKDSTLMLASFEMTTDHLFDGAVHGRTDAIDGVSECIILGIPVPLGTGLFKVLYRHPNKPRLPSRRPLLLDAPVKRINGVSHKKKI